MKSTQNLDVTFRTFQTVPTSILGTFFRVDFRFSSRYQIQYSTPQWCAPLGRSTIWLFCKPPLIILSTKVDAPRLCFELTKSSFATATKRTFIVTCCMVKRRVKSCDMQGHHSCWCDPAVCNIMKLEACVVSSIFHHDFSRLCSTSKRRKKSSCLFKHHAINGSGPMSNSF